MVVGVTGGPGAGLAVRLLEALAPLPVETHLVMCGCASRRMEREVGRTPDEVRALADRVYAEGNQAARISSGSFLTAGMIVAPCSNTSLVSIGLGLATNLIHRAADVTMKEGRPLVLLLGEEDLGPLQAEALLRLERVLGVTVLPPTDAQAAVADALLRLGVEPLPAPT